MKFQMLGDANHVGPVRLSDVYNSQVGDASTGIAASQKALYDAYSSLNSRFANTIGDFITKTSSGSATIANNEYKKITSLTLTEGRWFVRGVGSFITNEATAYSLMVTLNIGPNIQVAGPPMAYGVAQASNVAYVSKNNTRVVDLTIRHRISKSIEASGTITAYRIG